MRLLLNDYPGYAFPIQLSKTLARRGCQVLHLYAGYNNNPRGELQASPADPPGYRIAPLYIRQPLQKYSYFKRWQQEREYGALLAQSILANRPQVVISADTPLEAQRRALVAARQVGAHFIFWLQDLIGLATHRLLSKKSALLGRCIGGYYQALERRLIARSDHIVAIADDFRLFLQNQWRIPADRITVIPNWAVLDQLYPQPKRNPWSCQHGLADGFVFLYAGTLGLKHNPALLLDLALHFRQRPAIRVVVISEGPGADWLKEQKDLHNLENLRLLPYQPYHELQYVLAAADVLVAILEPEAGIFSVPSKVLTYLCAQRPLLLALPPENQAARLVARSAAGLVVPPGDLQAWRDAAEHLIQNPAMRQELACNARAYAETHFDIHKIADQFETILSNLTPALTSVYQDSSCVSLPETPEGDVEKAGQRLLP